MPKEPQPLNAEKLLAILTSVDRSLSHLSAVARLPHVYSEGSVKGLVEQYGKLKFADAAAFEALTQTGNKLAEEGLTYEQRVEKFGKDEADRHLAPQREALGVRRKTMAELGHFQKEHPLIVAIVDGTRCEG
ncbi:hypothetical protein [Xanthomonas oryzae]|uniref:hypothetical protein n=1 Tax=Xanthomonas oryzae TaxID=347 RepID=UPI003DA1A37B